MVKERSVSSGNSSCRYKYDSIESTNTPVSVDTMERQRLLMPALPSKKMIANGTNANAAICSTTALWLLSVLIFVSLTVTALNGGNGFLPIGGSMMSLEDQLSATTDGAGDDSTAAANAKSTARCEYVIRVLTASNENDNETKGVNNAAKNDTNSTNNSTITSQAEIDKLAQEALVREGYEKSTENVNVFYRATAELFWRDFVSRGYENTILNHVNAYKSDGFDDYNTWTWVTGDQHLSNFGAYRNRNNNIVFSVNDFDEAAIHSFLVDVLRVCVSIYNHAKVSGVVASDDNAEKHYKQLMMEFTNMYFDTVTSFVGNEDAATYEITSQTATGWLRDYLENVAIDNSHEDQLEKFTYGNGTLKRTEKTRLVDIDIDTEHAIRAAFTAKGYGATLMKTGWHVPQYDAVYYNVTDIARRTGSGVGSFGVDRYYILLNGGGTTSVDNNKEDEEQSTTQVSKNILLDVKYEPEGAVRKVLSDDDMAWYDILFPSDAVRAVLAQRQLTSYTDPYVGWVTINNNDFVVRQKSPWKDAPNLDKQLAKSYQHFVSFIQNVAVATATAHVRGSPAKQPGSFKEVIYEVIHNNTVPTNGNNNRRYLKKKKHHKKIKKHEDSDTSNDEEDSGSGSVDNEENGTAVFVFTVQQKWGDIISTIAIEYSSQVESDYQCFKKYVDALELQPNI